MAVQRGVQTSQNLQPSGRRFLIAGNPPPCYRDRWGTWECGHDHEDLIDLQDAYQYVEGWTAQVADLG